MSGVTHTGGIVGATVLGVKIVHGVLPFTGVAVGSYLVVMAGVLVTGAGFSLAGRRGRNTP